MNDEELKKLWQGQALREPETTAAEVVAAMQKQTSELRRCLNARDIRELAACAVVIIVFGSFFFTVYREPIPRFGDLIIIGGTIFIAWRIVHARRMTPPAPPGATVVESLQAELKSVQLQSHLLRTVLWWYLLPGFIGLLISTWGQRIHVSAKISCTVVFIAVDAFIYWLNQWARRKQLLPVEAQLQSLLHAAKTGEPLDETHVGTLRPVVLSMASAGRVKPVEFKVAFWQLALYGEIGFVGMWFFWMLVLEGERILRDLARGSTHFLPAVFSGRHVVWLAAFFLGGLLYSWLLQKTTERAVGISALGIHLHKGRNLVLWGEITEVRPLRILNIRSLWLIKESGEKMIMPWTSLERHSELRAAVEGCAPANHPLRKHLTWLRGI